MFGLLEVSMHFAVGIWLCRIASDSREGDLGERFSHRIFDATTTSKTADSSAVLVPRRMELKRFRIPVLRHECIAEMH